MGLTQINLDVGFYKDSAPTALEKDEAERAAKMAALRCFATPQASQIFTLNSSPLLRDAAKAASNCGIISRSFKLTTSTGECM